MTIEKNTEVSYAYTRHQIQDWDGHSDVKGAAVFEAPAPYFILFYVEHAQGNWFDVYWVNIRHRQIVSHEAPDP